MILQMRSGEFFHARPDFRFTDVPQTVRRRIPAVIRARHVRTDPAFHPLRRRMERRKPFRQLRAEEGEGGHAAERREVARAGIVADERTGAVNQSNQFRHRGGRGHAGFAGLKPPAALVGVAGDLRRNFFFAQSGGEPPVIFERPDADGLARAAVDQNGFTPGGGGDENLLARRQFEL